MRTEQRIEYLEGDFVIQDVPVIPIKLTEQQRKLYANVQGQGKTALQNIITETEGKQ